jgi:hypothetical protein
MNHRELTILNSLITFAAENIPGGLSSEEHEVAFQVACWTLDGIPVVPVCPHCGEPQAPGQRRLEWLEQHIDSAVHRGWWGLKNRLGIT